MVMGGTVKVQVLFVPFHVAVTGVCETELRRIDLLVGGQEIVDGTVKETEYVRAGTPEIE